MIMNIKQGKIKTEPRIKLNYKQMLLKFKIKLKGEPILPPDKQKQVTTIEIFGRLFQHLVPRILAAWLRD